LILSETPTGTFLGLLEREIFSNVYMGWGIGGGTPCMLIEPKRVKLPEGILTF